MTSILIIDDDSAVRHLLKAALKKDGTTFVEATNGVEALDHLATQQFDAILLDLMMPMMSGLEVLDHIAEKYPSRRDVIVLTAANPQFYAGLQHRCIRSIVRKPFDVMSLRGIVDAAIRREALVAEDDRAHQS